MEGGEGAPQGLGKGSLQQQMLQRPQAGSRYAAPAPGRVSSGAGFASEAPSGSGTGGLSASWGNKPGVAGGAPGPKEEVQELELAGVSVKLEHGGGSGGGVGREGGAGAAPGLTGGAGASISAGAGGRTSPEGNGTVRCSSGNSADSSNSGKSGGAHRRSTQAGAVPPQDQSHRNSSQGPSGAQESRRSTSSGTLAGASAGTSSGTAVTGVGRDSDSSSGRLLQEQERQLALLEAQQRQLRDKQSLLESAQAAHPSPAQAKEILLLQRLQEQQQQLVLLHRRQVQLLAEFGSQDISEQIQNNSPAAIATPPTGTDAATRAAAGAAGTSAGVGCGAGGPESGAAPGAPLDPLHAPLHFPEELRTVASVRPRLPYPSLRQCPLPAPVSSVQSPCASSWVGGCADAFPRKCPFPHVYALLP